MKSYEKKMGDWLDTMENLQYSKVRLVRLANAFIIYPFTILIAWPLVIASAWNRPKRWMQE